MLRFSVVALLAFSAACDSSIFHTLPAIAPPDAPGNACDSSKAPTDLAVSVDGLALTLTWTDHAAGTLTFRVERDEGDGFTDAANGLTSPEFTEQRGADTVVTYRVSGEGDGCTTSPSNTASRTTRAAGVVIQSVGFTMPASNDNDDDVPATVHFDASAVKTASGGFRVFREVDGGARSELTAVAAGCGAACVADDPAVPRDSDVSYFVAGVGPDVADGIEASFSIVSPPHPLTGLTYVASGFGATVTFTNPNTHGPLSGQVSLAPAGPSTPTVDVAAGVAQLGLLPHGDSFTVDITVKGTAEAEGGGPAAAGAELAFGTDCNDPTLDDMVLSFVPVNSTVEQRHLHAATALIDTSPFTYDIFINGVLTAPPRIGPEKLDVFDIVMTNETLINQAPLDSIVDVRVVASGEGCVNGDERTFTGLLTEPFQPSVTFVAPTLDGGVFDITNPNTLSPDLQVTTFAQPGNTPTGSFTSVDLGGGVHRFTVTGFGTDTPFRIEALVTNANTILPRATVVSAQTRPLPAGVDSIALSTANGGEYVVTFTAPEPRPVRVRVVGDLSGAELELNTAGTGVDIIKFDGAIIPVSGVAPVSLAFRVFGSNGANSQNPSDDVVVAAPFFPTQNITGASLNALCDLQVDAVPLIFGAADLAASSLDVDTATSTLTATAVSTSATVTIPAAPDTLTLAWTLTDLGGFSDVGNALAHITFTSGQLLDAAAPDPSVPGGPLSVGRQPFEAPPATSGTCGDTCGGTRARIAVANNGFTFASGNGGLTVATQATNLAERAASGVAGFSTTGCVLDAAGLNCPGVELAGLNAVPNVVDVASGPDGRTCVLTSTGQVRCAGGNVNNLGGTADLSGVVAVCPELGSCTAPVTSIAVSQTHTCAVKNNGDLACWGSSGPLGLPGGAPRGPVVTPARPVRQVAVGTDFTCVVLDNGTVECLGANLNGQLGTGDNLGHASPAFVCRSGGGDNLGCPGNDALQGVVAVAAGGLQACALESNGLIECWGDRSEVGGGFTSSGPVAPTVVRTGPGPQGALTDAVAVAASGSGTCAVVRDGRVFCWAQDAEAIVFRILHGPVSPNGFAVSACADAFGTPCAPLHADVFGCGVLGVSLEVLP